MNLNELDSQQFLNRPNVLTSSFYSNSVQSCLCMSLHPPASLFYHVYIVKGLKLNQRRILQVTGLWLRSSKRKGRVETRELMRRYATTQVQVLLTIHIFCSCIILLSCASLLDNLDFELCDHSDSICSLEPTWPGICYFLWSHDPLNHI